MQIFEIEVPDNKLRQVKRFLKGLGITVKLKETHIPNADTIAAMNELKNGNGKKLNTIEELFNSI